jgi:leucyl-tRNA synthetase
VKLMQENWIGRSEGVRFAFPHDIRGDDGKLIGDGRMYVFTTRADTIMGVTFCAVAPEHPLAAHAARNNPKLAAFIEDCKKGGTTEAELALREKRKACPPGLQVTHPLTGEPVDVWVGNYVLMGYGDGAVMGVPGHDERDFAFALKYGLPIMQVVHVDGETYDYHHWQEWYADKERGVTINSDIFSGFGYQEAVTPSRTPGAEGPGREEDHLAPARLGREPPALLGHAHPHHPLRRARRGAGAGEGPARGAAAGLRARRQRQPAEQARGLPGLQVPGVRQAGAARDRHHGHLRRFVLVLHALLRPEERPRRWSAEGTQYWMPMDQYIGGIEHAILHLLYARFWTKVMRDMGLVKIDEPFTKLLTQGMVLNEAFSRTTTGKQYFWAHELDIVRDEHAKVISATAKADGQPVTYEGWTTMSKSKNNGVDPQDLIEKYGADTARLYTMFTAPPEATLEWNDAALEGSYRFLRRVWNFGHRLSRAVRPRPGRRPAAGYGKQRRRCAARCIRCSSRSTTTTSACSTTPSSRAR